MKKFLACVLVLSTLVLCSCGADVNMGTEQTSDISSIQKEEVTTSSNIEVLDESTESQTITTSQESKPTVTSKETNLQPQKTIINVNPETAEMGFRAINGGIKYPPPPTQKFFPEPKSEDYTKSNVPSRNFEIFETKYTDLEYDKSRKYSNSDLKYDIFKNDTVEIFVTPNGEVIRFETQSPIKVFQDDRVQSVILAKRYMQMLFPNYEYNDIKFTYNDHFGDYIYYFYKKINGLRTSECVSINMNSYGSFRSYHAWNLGGYDDIEINNLNVNDFLPRMEAFIKETCPDSFIDFGIEESRVQLDLLANNKVELEIEVWVTLKSTVSGFDETKTGEIFVFRLN